MSCDHSLISKTIAVINVEMRKLHITSSYTVFVFLQEFILVVWLMAQLCDVLSTKLLFHFFFIWSYWCFHQFNMVAMCFIICHRIYFKHIRWAYSHRQCISTLDTSQNFQYIIIILELNQICGFLLPRESRCSTRLL